jgi:hypothetical protein
VQQVDLDALDRMHAEGEGKPIEWGSYVSYIWDDYPALAAELREARREVAELRASNAKLAWAWNTVQDENASRAAEGAKVLQAAVACMNSLAWLDARDRRMKAKGAAEWIRKELKIAYEANRPVVSYQRVWLRDVAAQLEQRAAELEAAAEEGEK